MKKSSWAWMVLLVLLGCGDSTGPEIPNFEGQYTVGGTINGFPNSDVTGSISVTNQSRTSATIVQTFNFRDGGQTIFTLFTESPAAAELSMDASISWSFSFENTTFTASGQLQGNTLNGTWNWTGPGEGFAGSFSATR